MLFLFPWEVDSGYFANISSALVPIGALVVLAILIALDIAMKRKGGKGFGLEPAQWYGLIIAIPFAMIVLWILSDIISKPGSNSFDLTMTLLELLILALTGSLSLCFISKKYRAWGARLFVVVLGLFFFVSGLYFLVSGNSLSVGNGRAPSSVIVADASQNFLGWLANTALWLFIGLGMFYYVYKDIKKADLNSGQDKTLNR